MRSLWSAHAAGPLRQAAFALDAAVFDLAYITGPVVASSLAAGLSPATAVGVLLALTAAATAAISRRGTAGPAAPDAGRAPRHRSFLGPLGSPGLRRLLLTGALVNLALSATEVALTGYVRLHHALWASGPLLAEVSAGSIAGSLLLGARAAGAGAADERRRLPWMVACYSAGLAVLAAALLRVPLAAVAAPLAGLCLGPTLATLFGLASSAVPGGGTEAQAWLNCAMNGGAAAGAALAGVTAGAPALSLAVTAGIAALAAGTAVGQRPRRRRRRPGAKPRRGGYGGGTPHARDLEDQPAKKRPNIPDPPTTYSAPQAPSRGLLRRGGYGGGTPPCLGGSPGGSSPRGGHCRTVMWQIFGNSRVMSYRMDFCTLRSLTMRSSKGGRLGGVLAAALRAHAPDVVAP